MGDIGMLEGGLLAWKLCCKGRRVVGDVVDHRGISSGLGVYRRGEGEETVNTSKQMHDKSISDARGVLTQCYTIPTKGGNIRESFAGVRHFWTNETEGAVAGLVC